MIPPPEKHPLRIGFILPTLVGGGAERSVLRLAGGFLERGHQVDLILLRPTGPYRKAIPSGIRIFHTAYPFHLRKVPGTRAFLSDVPRQGLMLEQLSVSPWGRFRAFHVLSRRWSEGCLTSRDALYGVAVSMYLRRNQPDVLFAAEHQANTAAVCGRTLAGMKTPVVVSLRGDPALGYIGETLQRARSLYQEADAVVAVSKGVAKAGDALGLSPNRVVAIYNPIPIAEITTAATEPVEHPWFSDSEVPVVLTVGRPVYVKDHPTLVRAFASLCHSMEARLAILCGMGSYTDGSFEETQELAISLGVAKNIAYLNFDENPFRYMSKAGVMALSSRHEGFPNVLLEAMACGTPVVSTDAPYGPAEILEGGRWGPLVPIGDADALAEAIVDILAGRRIPAKELRERAAVFSPEKAVDKYEELFSSLSY